MENAPTPNVLRRPNVKISENPVEVARPTLSRRTFLRQNLAMLGAAMVGNGLTEASHIEVTHHTVPLANLQAPIRVAQLSDLHRSWCVSEGFIAHVVAKTNALRPDLILLTGDYVTRASRFAGSCAACLAELRAPLGVYGVLGNHDYGCDNGAGGPHVAEALVSANVRLLINESARLDNGLTLIGIDDCGAGRPNPREAFADMRADEAAVIMTHNPNLFPRLCHPHAVTLAGHMHGGQINIPRITQEILRSYTRYLRGWYNSPCNAGRMYVSRGLGVVSIPMRFRSTPEIALFTFLPA